MSKTIAVVVDADVASAAGKSEHLTSKSSRKVMETVREKRHSVLFCKSLMNEWRNHQSRYSSSWLNSMISKKLVINNEPECNVEKILENFEMSESKKREALKDAHLVNLVLGREHLIISKDNAAREIYSEVRKENSSLRGVVWVNPVTYEERLVSYLGNVCIPPKEWSL
ncbi:MULTISPECIES: hypothetical protein [Chromobacterium]|uniref:hypothetical protein n=1 Tax=Chromobacterium TaxID=535 RepID=UPI001E316979|nr:hypothetical protein [Chromobacterium violaceum]MCD0491596.1 hypothetical protein [Chromobacterium violaceum]